MQPRRAYFLTPAKSVLGFKRALEWPEEARIHVQSYFLGFVGGHLEVKSPLPPGPSPCRPILSFPNTLAPPRDRDASMEEYGNHCRYRDAGGLTMTIATHSLIEDIGNDNLIDDMSNIASEPYWNNKNRNLYKNKYIRSHKKS